MPAPVRLVAEFDNLVLSHANRSRVVSAENLRRFYVINGIFPGAVLIDGFVAGIWRLASKKSMATLTVELFGPAGELDALVDEAGRMMAFCAPGASPAIRFAPIA
jgi:Winged helix DNA-binding domain